MCKNSLFPELSEFFFFGFYGCSPIYPYLLLLFHEQRALHFTSPPLPFLLSFLLFVQNVSFVQIHPVHFSIWWSARHRAAERERLSLCSFRPSRCRWVRCGLGDGRRVGALVDGLFFFFFFFLSLSLSELVVVRLFVVVHG